MSYLCPHQCEGKTEYGYCRYTWCVNPLHNNLGTAQQGQGVQRAVITNADRIRSMTDEELAEWISEYTDCLCGIHKPGCSKTKSTCVATWLDWLRQEANDAD